MDPTELLLVCLIVFAGHAIGGIAAYGSVLVALPFMVLATNDPDTSVRVLLVFGMTQAALILLRTWRHIDRRALATMLVLAGAGLPAGHYFESVLPERPVLIALGAVVAASGLSRLLFGLRRAPTETVSENPVGRVLTRALILLGGVIHGAFGAGGGTLVIYAQRALPRKEAFRGTMCTVWLCLNPVVLAMKGVGGGFGPKVFWWALAGLPFLLAGNWVAQRVAERIDQKRFAQFVALLLVVSGGRCGRAQRERTTVTAGSAPAGRG